MGLVIWYLLQFTLFYTGSVITNVGLLSFLLNII